MPTDAPTKRRRPAVTAPRARRVKQMQELDARLGRRALNREVAAALDVSLSYASGLRLDPTGEQDRERKRRYYVPCEDCGEPCYASGNDGLNRSRICGDCMAVTTEPRPRVRPYRPLKIWGQEKLVDAVVTWSLENGRLPRLLDFTPAAPGRYPCSSTFYRYFPWPEWQRGEDWAGRQRRAFEQPGAVAGAIVAAIRQDRIPVSFILAETNQVRRAMFTEAYGLARLIRQGELLHEDDFGKLWRLDLAADRRAEIVEQVTARVQARKYRHEDSDAAFEVRLQLQRANLPEPVVMVEVLNSTPEPDGSFKDYWLRVPPTMETARQAVAWTFGLADASDYELAVQT